MIMKNHSNYPSEDQKIASSTHKFRYSPSRSLGGVKITVIGGGSYMWTFGFVRQFVQSKNLAGATLCLMDINQEALDCVARAGRLYNERHGAPLVIEATRDPDLALTGAQFVLVAISTGGLAAMGHDLRIPEKYGIWQTVGDTVGPSGWSRAARNIPVFQDLARRMQRVCPDAWMLNCTNPLTVLTRVPTREYGIKTIGMCPGVENQARAMARVAGAPPDARLDYVVTGIDHGSWFTRLHANGVDILQRLKELGYCRSDDQLPGDASTKDPLAENARNRAIFALWKETGYLPSIGDRHHVENHPWFITNETGELPFGITRTSMGERQEWRVKFRESLERYIAHQDDSQYQGHGDDPICEVVESLCGYKSFLYCANFRNIGQLPEAPADAVVETRCLFDAAGVHPLCSPMPEVLKTMVIPHIYRQEAMIEVVLRGTFDEFVALVITDPLCSRLPMGACRQMMKELLLANRDLIANPRLLEF